MMSKSAKSSVLAFIVLSVLGYTIYSNSFDVPFYLDDFRNITENLHVRIKTVSFATLYDAAFNSPIRTRPLAYISFALNFALHQDNLFGYHLVNITLHVFVAFFLYMLFSATLSTPVLISKYKNIEHLSLLGSLLWLVHPLHTNSVVYIVQRMVLLAVLFYVLAILCYVKGRMTHSRRVRWGWLSCSLISAILAMASKEITATLPFVIILYEWYFFQDLDRSWLYKKLWLVTVCLVVIFIGYTLYIGSAKYFFSDYVNRPFTMLERVLTEFRVVLFYIGLLFYPNPGRLSLDHDFPVSHSLFDPVTTVLSAGGIILALLVSVLVAKKQRVLSFAIVWYFGNLVLESSFINLELIFEHRTYLPSIFIPLAFVVFLAEYVRARVISVGIPLVIVGIFSYWTFERNKVWKDPVVFWTDCVEKAPRKARPYLNLSVSLRERGNIDAAIDASRKAISIDSRYVNGFVGLGAAYAEKDELDKAVFYYKKALGQLPDYAEVYNALGLIYIKQGKIKDAVAGFNENLRLDPASVNALVNRASIMAYQGNFSQAIADFHKALKTGGANPDILYNLAVTYLRNGSDEKALTAFEAVLQLNPDDQQALSELKQLRSRLTR